MVVSAEVDVDVAGDYRLTVVLVTADAQSLVGRGEASLTVGAGRIIGADFFASQFLELTPQVDGPYTIIDVQLVFYGPLGEDPAMTTDQRFDIQVQTAAYQIAQFEPDPITLIGQFSETTVDEEPDGDIDILLISMDFVIVTAGTYQYSASLVDGCGEVIEITGGEWVVPGGTAPLGCTVTFDGEAIGSHGLDGPYLIDSLTIYGPASLVTHDVYETQAYTAAQFDGFTGAPDCNGNSSPDPCDVLGGPSFDANYNGIPDECEIPCVDVKKLKATCVANLLKVTVVMETLTPHVEEQVVVDVNGNIYFVIINANGKAKLQFPDSHGAHDAALLAPGACEDPVSVDCGP